MNHRTTPYKYTQLQASRYVGKRVHTTDNQFGYVAEAHPSGDGSRIILHVWTGNYSLVTDNEHATIVAYVLPNPVV